MVGLPECSLGERIRPYFQLLELSSYKELRLSDPFYRSKDWFRARAKVLARDNYQCVFCGVSVRGKGLGVVDHIHRRKVRPDLSLELSNLQTLCTFHHESTKKIVENRADQPVISASGFPPGWE